MTKPLRETVLVVEDEPSTVQLMVRLLSARGYQVAVATDGERALEMIARRAPDLIVLDVELPGIDGFEVCRRLKEAPATRLIPVVFLTGLTAREDRIRGIRTGADDFLPKPFDAEELYARVSALLRLKRYTDDLESAESVILSLAMTVEARDAYTLGHCQRLAWYATALGKALGLGDEELAALHRGGYLHDLGKIGIADAVLQKPGKLTAGEYESMKEHPIIGERLCGNLRSLRLVRPIVRHHHERRDGSGYPDGLRNDDIPLLAQVVAVADLYDAVTTTRPYRAASPVERAYAELTDEVVKGVFRRDLVETFIRLGRSGLFRAMSPADGLLRQQAAMRDRGAG